MSEQLVIHFLDSLWENAESNFLELRELKLKELESNILIEYVWYH